MASRVIQFSPKLGALICFAKSGEMFEKYSPYSDWQSKEATGIRRAVSKRRVRKGMEVIRGIPHVREVDAKGQTSLRPAKANELIDVDAYRREKHKLLIKTSQPDLDKKLVAAPTEQARVAVRREHLAGIRKQLKQPPSVIHQEIKNIRGSMAGELRTTHRIIGGIRDEAQRRGLPRPIGIPGNRGGHGIDRPFVIGEFLPAAVEESRTRLKTIVAEKTQARKKSAEQIDVALRKKIGAGIQKTKISEGKTPFNANVLNSKVHEAMEPFRRKVPPSREEYGNIAGYFGPRTPLKKLERIRTRLDDLREGTGTEAYHAKLERNLIKSGKIFQSPSAPRAAATSTPRSFPHLRKIGIGAGIVAAVTGAVIAKKRAQKKQKPIALSARHRPIEFARGDIYSAVKTTLIGGTALIKAPKSLKRRVSLRIAAAKGDAPGFRAHAKEMGWRKLQVVSHRMQTERDRAAAELRALRIGAKGVLGIKTQLQGAHGEIERLQNKVEARGKKIVKLRGLEPRLRGERVSPGEAFARGQAHGEGIGAQREQLKSAGLRQHFDNEITRVANEKDATHAAKVKEIRSGQNKRIAIGTATGATVGGVAGYETGKDRKRRKIDTVSFSVDKPRKIQKHPDASVAAHAVTGGIEGAVGIYATDPLLEFLRHGKRGIRNPLRDTFRGHVNKISTGAVIGALATAPIGWAVERERRARRERSLKPIQFDTRIPGRTAVAGDRYRKRIHETDQDRAESSYLRTALTGAALSALIRKKTGLTIGNALATGGAAGLVTQAATRIATSRTKDQFGDRSYAAKRIDRAPSQLGTAAVIGVSGHRILKEIRKIRKAGRVVGFHAHGAILEFDRSSKWDPNREGFNVRRRGEDLSRWSGRAIGVIKDIKGAKGVDARGRKKTPEWQKPWVRNAATVAILGATVAGVRSARGFVHGAAARDIARGEAPGGLAKLSEVIKSGTLRRAAENKIPGVRQVSNFLGKAKREVEVAASDPLGKLATKIERAAHEGPRPIHVAPGVTKQSPTGAITHIPAGSEAAEQAERRRQQQVRKKLGKIIRGESTDLSSKISLIAFAERINDWDIRDPRGRSARVYAPGSQRRYRRPKRFYERKDNQRVIHQAELGGALIAGTLLAGANRRPIQTTQTVTEVARKIVPGESALEKLLRESRVRRLNAQLDQVINLST